MSTLVAGVIADIWGPATGGLFLAFPAILCASATLVEPHSRREKVNTTPRAIAAAPKRPPLETAGAALGSVALAIFALVVWRLVFDFLGAISLAFGFAGWLLLVSVALWRLRRYVRRTC